MARGYRFVGHTSEVEFEASGRTMEECFRNSLAAMFDTICYADKAKGHRSKRSEFRVRDSAANPDDLLWYSLQDALSISDSKGLFPYSVRRLRITERGGKYSIDASISAREKSDHLSRLEVKGVSRYNISVRKSGTGFRATAVLDV